MAKYDTVEANRLKLYFKNSDLLQFEPCISLEINDFEKIPADRFYELLSLLKSWFIKDVYINTSNLDALSNIEGSVIKDFRLYIRLSKDVDSIIRSKNSKKDDILSKFIFSSKDYYVETNHYEQSVLSFYSYKPEIYLITPVKKNIKLKLEKIDNIEALFLFDGNKITNCSNSINKKNGVFKYNCNQNIDYKLLVLRNLRVRQSSGKLKYYLNYFDKNILNSILKEIITKLKIYKKIIYGVYYNLDDIISLPDENNMFPYDDNKIGNNLGIIAEYYLTDHRNEGTYKNILDEIYKKKLSSVFLAKLNSIFSRVKYFITADNPHILNTDFTFQSIFKINAERFYHQTPYFENITINLLRTISTRHAQDITDLTISIHNIFNTRYSFSQKKHHIDYLFTLGVDKILFNTDELSQIFSDNSLELISEIDPNYLGYSEWFYYLHQLGNLMKKGIGRSDILIIYPSLDNNDDNLRITIRELDRIGYNYDLIKFDDFENDIICSLDQGVLNFNNKIFKIVILPGINHITLKLIEKLYTFFENGGIIIALQQLPEITNFKKDFERLKYLKKHIWLDEAEIISTNFRQNEKGGYGYYQPEISKLSEILLTMSDHLKFHLLSESEKLRFIVKETDSEFYIFIINLNSGKSVPYTIKTKFIGKPFIWNFKVGESYAFGMWYIEGEWMYLNDSLSGNESRLYVLDKKSSLKTWQVKNASFTGCRVLKQNTSMLNIKGWMRENNDVNLELVKDRKKIKEQIKGMKISPILVISSNRWYLDSDTFQGKVNLGNHSIAFPFDSHVLLYQKIIIIGNEYLKNKKLFLEIGKVLDWCTLYVNDELVEQRLSPPWIFDITKFVRKGENKITIKVVNSLSNRLAKNDSQHKFTVSEYGLFGPVRIIPYNIYNLKI